MESKNLSIDTFATMILKASRIVSFTGAGISTAAGIPDFRGPKGLYVTGQYDPDLVFEINYFKKHPDMFYQFSREFISILKTIQPTFTHFFLARLEKQGKLLGTITQNIDTLHRMAGSRQMAEVHGSYASASCLDCQDYAMHDLTLDWWEQQMDQSPRSPVVLCPCCQGVVKPNVVFFGEQVKDLDLAESWIHSCDLLLILGSSLTVYPVAFLPHLTNAPTIIINQGEPESGRKNEWFSIESDLDHFFKKVVDFIDYEN